MPRAHIRGKYAENWPEISVSIKTAAGWRCVRCLRDHNPSGGRCLTVHHFNGDKGNNQAWNLMALCQVCHLQVQGRVDPRESLLFAPSTWAMPYVHGAIEAGVCVAPPGYDLAAWRKKYENEVGPWPDW